MFSVKNSPVRDEITAALNAWKLASKKFENAKGDEVRFASLEVEAAKQRYIFLLSKKRVEAGIVASSNQ